MKKFLITISPLCAILFAAMWFSWGLKGAVESINDLKYRNLKVTINDFYKTTPVEI